jgi:hypothetical protein
MDSTVRASLPRLISPGRKMDVRSKARFLTFCSTSPFVCGYRNQLSLFAFYKRSVSEASPKPHAMLNLTLDVSSPKYGTPASFASSANLVTYSKSTAQKVKKSVPEILIQNLGTNRPTFAECFSRPRIFTGCAQG